MKLIQLTKGHFSKVDDEDFNDLIKYKWHVQINHYKSRSILYAARSIRDENGKRQQLFIHQVVLGGKKNGFVSDHIDFDGLNNTRSNLRYLTQRDNLIHSPSREKPFVEKIRVKRSEYILQIKNEYKWYDFMTFNSMVSAHKYCITKLELPIPKNKLSYNLKKYGYLKLVSSIVDCEYRFVNKNTKMISRQFRGIVTQVFEEEFKKFLRGETNINPRTNKIEIPLL